jgi:hypothetical protein
VAGLLLFTVPTSAARFWLSRLIRSLDWLLRLPGPDDAMRDFTDFFAFIVGGGLVRGFFCRHI